MCGIVGSLNESGKASRQANVERMISTLAHRGPDDAGIWSEPGSAACLGHRRLAVIDCSRAGHQPMLSPSQRYVLVLNGEIYNHGDLRDQLDAAGLAPAWRGTSDTEVLAAALDAWGVEAAVEACVGMFALAVWDRASRRLTLGRDRIGEKPLYFGRFRGVWLFASELKAIVAHPAFERAIDAQALSTYMTLGYVPAPASIYQGVFKVRPACLVSIDADTDAMHERPYWSALDSADPGRRSRISEAEAVDTAEALLSRAVAQQMVADRPLGALLSGGIDSSCVVALMQAHASAPVRTFSIGFHESSFNEAAYARAVASHFGTHHTELYATPADARAIIPRLPQIYDEPFADSSQIPTYMVSRLARASVTVALTGDGGDELFGGYPRYAMGSRLWSALRHVPAPLRRPIGGLMQRLAPQSIDRLFARAFPQDARSGGRALRPAQKLAKLGHVLRSRDIEALYLHLLSPWAEPALLAPALRTPALLPGIGASGAATVAEDFMLRDLLGYLPDDILAKTDRAAMAVSLETRAPFLDHRVVEFALGLPLELKMRGGVNKWLLRQVLYRHIPQAVVDRPKMGFSVPLAAWLRGPLREWAADLIASGRSEAALMLDRRTLSRLLDEHVAGIRDWHQALWAALMFLAWDEQVGASAARGAFEPGESALRKEPSGIARAGSPSIVGTN